MQQKNMAKAEESPFALAKGGSGAQFQLSSSLAGDPVGEVPATVSPSTKRPGERDLRRNNTDNFDEVKQMPPEMTPKLNGQDCDEASEKLIRIKQGLTTRPFTLQRSVEPRGPQGIIGAVENGGSSLGGFMSPRGQQGRASQARLPGGGILLQSLQVQRLASVQNSMIANAHQNRRFTAKVSQVVPPESESDERDQSSNEQNSKVLVSPPPGEKKSRKARVANAESPTKNGPFSPDFKPADLLDNTPAQGEDDERRLMNASALNEAPLGEQVLPEHNKSKSICLASPEEGIRAPPFRKSLLKEEEAKAKEVMAQQDPVANAGVAEESGEEDDEESGEGKFPQDVLFTNANDSKINNQMGSKQAGVPARRTNVIDTKHDNYHQIKRELEDSNVYFLNNLRREIDREAKDLVIDPIEGRAADDASYFNGISELLIQVQPSEDARYDKEMLDLSTPAVSRINAGAAVNRKTDKPRELPQQVAMSAETKRNTFVAARVRHEHVTRDESFMFSRLDDASRHKSMLLNSQDFDESKLLFTERRVLQLAEMDREYSKLLSGQWLQTAINEAKPNDVITLEKKTYKFQSLFIGSPITILGQPETVLEVDGGSIVIDFQRAACDDGLEVGNAADEELIVAQTPAHRASAKSFGRQAATTTVSQAKSTYDRGTPLNIKKSKVAKIQVCEIRYNRTKASLLQAGRRKDARAKHGTHNVANTEAQQFSRNISLEKTGGQLGMGANGGNTPAGQPSQTLLQINTSAYNAGLSQNNTLLNQASADGPSNAPLACFLIEQDSYVEIKDCFIKSQKDQNNFYQELDNFIKYGGCGTPPQGQAGHQSSHQCEGTQTGDNLVFGQPSEKNPDFLEWMQRVDNEIRDYCFVLNLGEDERVLGPLDYSGLVSLSSTTVQNFKVGVYCGPDAVLTAESSSFIAMRAGGVAIKSHLPKLLKVLNGSIQKCEAHGIQVTLDEPPVPDFTRFVPSESPSRRDTERLRGTVNSQRDEVIGTEPLETEQDEGGAGQRLVRKVYIDNNRIVQVQGCPISIEGPERPHYLHYLIKVKDNRISNCGLESKLYAIPGATEREKEQEKVQMAKAYLLIGGQPQSCILLQNLSVFNLVCFRNTISKGSGSGIKFFNCKGHRDDMSAVSKLPVSEAEASHAYDRLVGDQQRVTVIDNYIIDTVEGYGMIIDSTTCYMELNQLKKNAYGGLLVTTSHLERFCPLQRVQSANTRGTMVGAGPPAVGFSLEQYETARSDKMAGSLSQSRLFGQTSVRDLSATKPTAAHKLSQVRAFNMVTCDNSTAMANQRFGVAVLQFYGSVTFKNTQANENDGHGFVLQRQAGALLAHEQEHGEHDEACLDVELTDRSRTLRHGAKGGLVRSRSPTAFAPTDNMMFEQNATSFRAEDTQMDKQAEPWPFEGHASQLHLFKCVVLQNRQEGIHNVDYRLFSLGTVIQGNSVCAVRTMQPERGAELNIFIKSRANDNDLIGQVLGAHSRMTPNIKVDANMQVLLKNMKALQLQQIYAEMIKMTHGQEPEATAAAKTKGAEKQLISIEEKKQINIDPERAVVPVGRRSPSGAPSGCFFKLFNCCAAKASDGRPLKSPPMPPEVKSRSPP